MSASTPMSTDRGEDEPNKVDGGGKGKKGDDDVICLKPKMTLINGITVIVGSIIGSGIFVSPKGVLKGTGSVGMSLVVWISCGIYSLVGAYCYAELGCMITKSGADYAYIMDSFGPFVAFLRLWVECMIVRPCSQAIVALTFSKYMLRPLFPDCLPPSDVVTYLALICIGLLTFVNCWNVKWATRVQDFFTYGKLLALATIISAGFVNLSKGGEYLENFNFNGTSTDIPGIGLAYYSGLFAYNGWNYLNFVIEELIDPHRNLPIAIFISCILCTAVYALTIVAFHTTLSVEQLLAAEVVGVAFAEQNFGRWAFVVPIFVALSTFGGVNGILFTSSRLFYAGADYNQMPQLLSMIQLNHKTPVPAVLAMSILSLVYLTSDSIEDLITYVGFATWLAIGLAVACVPYLRWRSPELPRPIKVNLIFPYVYIIATMGIIISAMIDAPVSTALGSLMIASGIPVYFVFIAWKSKPRTFTKAIESWTKCMQKFLVVVPADKTKV